MVLGYQESFFDCDELYVKSETGCGRYRYKVFGLHIASDLFLPDIYAPDTFDAPDVNIRLGKVPAGIIDAMEKNEKYQVAANRFLMQVPGVGRYYVMNGNYIVIEPAEQAEERIVRLFLLGSVFGVLLMQRGIPSIHGSAVVINDCGVIFTGYSGAGKSTLLAAFRERGYSYLTDDVAAVTVDADGVPWVQAAYPQQKLWRDSAEVMGFDITSHKPIYIWKDKDKFTIPAHKGFWPSPVPLAAIYELETERRQDVTLRPFSGMEKLAVLINHTYRLELIDGLGVKTEHFKHCAGVVRRVAVSRLIRPEGVFSVGEQIRLVEQDVARHLANEAKNTMF